MHLHRFRILRSIISKASSELIILWQAMMTVRMEEFGCFDQYSLSTFERFRAIWKADMTHYLRRSC
jgi:hypothetical protein